MKYFATKFTAVCVVLLFASSFALSETANAQDIIGYWNFNDNVPESNTNWTQPISATQGDGEITYTVTEAYSFSGTSSNSLNGDASGGSFVPRGGSDQVNNGESFTISASTAGLDEIYVSWANRGTSTGFDSREIQYTTNGTDWISKETMSGTLSDWEVVTVDFSDIPEVNDNPDFAVRVILSGATSDAGNNRFDNIIVQSGETTITPATEVATIAELRNGNTDGTRYRLTGEALVHFSEGYQGRRMLVDGSAGIWSIDPEDNFTGGTTIGDGITGLEGTLDVDNNGALIRFILDEGSADATVSSTGNTIDPETTTIPNLSLEDTGKLVLIESVTFQETGTFDTGTNYTLEDESGNTLTFRTDYFGADYINEPIPTTPQDIVGVVGGYGSSPQIFARSSADITDAGPFANLQIIHNSPDPAIQSVDIFVNGEEFLSDRDYKSASEFMPVPAGVELSIEIAPAGDGIDAALDPVPVTLNEGENYIAVASGVVETADFTDANSFSLQLLTGAQLSAVDENEVDVVVHHGSPDAPNVDIYLEQTGSDTPAFSNLGYPDFTDYVGLAPTNEVAAIAGAGGEILFEFSVPFATLDVAGASVTVLATGFFDESNVTDGNGFGLIAVLADGTVLELEQYVPTAILQIIHNSPDPALESVDIFVNDQIAYESLNFREATMFDPVPAGVDLSIEIAPAGAGIENALDPIAVTLDESESYIAVASGVLASSGFTNTADFSLELFTGGKANSANENGVELNVHHGAPDAPNVDIYLEQTGSVDPAVSNLAYSDFTGYVPFASNDETIGIAGTGGDILLEFPAPLSSFTGEAITVLASGFFNTENVTDGNSFGLLVVQNDGTTTLLQAVSTSIDEIDGMPQEFALEQNYPNPFNPSTKIEYALPQAASVQIAVYNVVGKRVATLLNNEQQSAGFHSVSFDASNLASGMYLYRIQAGNFIQTRKMTLIK